MENSREVPSKIKNSTIIWFSNFSSGYLPNKNKRINLKRYMHPPTFTATSIVMKICKQAKLLEWIKKMLVHMHNGILLSHKKDKILPFATTWIHLEGIMLSEKIRKCHMTSLTWRIRKTKQANKAKWKETHRYREQIGICQRGGYERRGKRWKGLKGKISSYKMNKPWGYNIQCKEYGQ